jgi:hypothetical protein
MTGCADSVLFVTKTSIGLDFDTKPPAANIAYDRVEGYIGPRYDNGAVPPVLARIHSDAAVFNAKVRQIYATGPAAQRILATPNECRQKTDTCPPVTHKLTGGKRLMFFGTTTSTGLKVTFSPEYQYPDSFHLGYKRKEFSFIPIGHDEKTDEDKYPSVLAAVNTKGSASIDKGQPSARLLAGQFFATGAAAEQLAQKADIQRFFKEEMEDMFQSYRDSKAAQEHQAKRVLLCYFTKLKSDDNRVSAWEDANKKHLFWEPKRLEQLRTLLQESETAPSTSAEKMAEANQLYAADIAIVSGDDPERLELLSQHREHVCGSVKPAESE